MTLPDKIQILEQYLLDLGHSSAALVAMSDPARLAIVAPAITALDGLSWIYP